MGKKLEDYSLLSKNKTIISLKDLDRTDQAIIKALQENARLSNVGIKQRNQSVTIGVFAARG
jgi:hypothetical protein